MDASVAVAIVPLITFRDELPSMAPGEDAKLLAKTTFLFEEFLSKEIEAGRFCL